MSNRKLAVNVTLDGVTYEAGTVPPSEVAEQITNPKAYGDEPTAEGDDGAKQSAKKAAPRKSS